MQSGYNLDVSGVLRFQNLAFKDTNYYLHLLEYKQMSLEARYKIINQTLHTLDSSTNKGFLTSYDLTKFPIISDLIPSFFQGDAIRFYDYVKGEKSMETYKWLYNFILVTLYTLCIETLHDLSYPEDDNTVLALKALERELFGRLDPSIRQKIQNRGVSIKENIYIGFDTEFTKDGPETNLLVSAQLAVTTKIYVQIPLHQPYQISILDEKSNKIKYLNKSSSVLNYSKIETSIQMCVEKVRSLKYARNDAEMLVLTECLRMIKGLSYIEKDDFTTFCLPRSVIQPFIHYGNSFSLREIIEISSKLAKPSLEQSNNTLMTLLKDISSRNFNLLEGKEKMLEEVKKVYGDYGEIEKVGEGFDKPRPLITFSDDFCEELSGEKRLTRYYLYDLLSQRVSVTKTKNYYLIAHLTQADLSMLNDFDDVKEDLSIVNGSFITLAKPIKFRGKNVHIRDTILLAPGMSRSLSSIGKLYNEEFNKVKISKNDLEDMQGFLKRDKEKFTEYALKDAIISLIHASWMEDFNFKIGGVGIPVSLSSLGRNYVKSIWAESKYEGYQISQKYLLGDVSRTITPKGLNEISEIAFVLPLYIANYKGGRNECFMYGVDRDGVWFDYDLSSAYTTVMSMAGHPDYAKSQRLTVSELKRLSKVDLLFSYLIIHAEFEFPEDTKYPSIPCYVDTNCTIYPLKGKCVLTGSEYLLATSQGCVLRFIDIYHTPFRLNKPFSDIISFVQKQRREHNKGTISNLLYKEIGNSIYGSVVRGIGDKRKFDIKSKGTIRMYGDELTNPLIASWTTAFVRSIIGECLHSIQKVGGLVVSVTTDGFITNISELENKISDNFLLSEFKKIRAALSGDNKALELKTNGNGIIAWSTRGQFGFESRIIATTGFQSRIYPSKQDLIELFLQTIKSEHKTIEYIQSRLRSATDIFKKGGHVTMQYRDQMFRMHFDNRRVLLWETTIPANCEMLLDSRPLANITEGENLRFISSMYKKKLYGKYTSMDNKANKYTDTEEIAVRNFLKGLLTTPPMFNLKEDVFYTRREIIDFIQQYNPKYKYTEIQLAKYKRRGISLLKTHKTKETEAFLKYVKAKFNDFDEESFYAKS